MSSPIINTTSFVNGLSHFKNPSATLPTVIIESCCTAGRTHQSYKRGGTLEAKERFREEVTSGIFWIWGVKGLNKIGDIIGEKVFKIKDITDTGKDFLRDPGYSMSNNAKIFKFGKIISSVIIATGFMGFVVPKINHAITAHTMQKNKKSNGQKLGIDDFINNSIKKENNEYINSREIAFRGKEDFANFLMKASYNLENNNTWRLISTDTGMVAGRVINSRHPAEALEYTFRDTSSIYFYNFATPTVIFALNKLFKTPDIHPKVISQTNSYLQKNIADLGLSGKELIEKIDGTIKDARFNQIDFKNQKAIELDELIGQLDKLGFDRVKDAQVFKKAELMSQLQPKLRGKSVLSVEQVKDVFSQSITSDPEFLKETINKATYGRAQDPKKFVSAQTCQNIRESIDKYILEIAGKNKDKIIDENLLKSSCRKMLARTAAFQALGMLFSIFGLAILIPKLQIFISQKVFGKKSFEDIANGKTTQQDDKSAV